MNTYADSGRLSSVSNGSATASYVIDALGRRVKKSGVSVTLFVYDEARHLLEEYDGLGNLLKETVWMGDTPVATLQPNGTGLSVYYIPTDHLNTPRWISWLADNVIVWLGLGAFRDGGCESGSGWRWKSIRLQPPVPGAVLQCRKWTELQLRQRPGSDHRAIHRIRSDRIKWRE